MPTPDALPPLPEGWTVKWEPGSRYAPWPGPYLVAVHTAFGSVVHYPVKGLTFNHTVLCAASIVEEVREHLKALASRAERGPDAGGEG